MYQKEIVTNNFRKDKWRTESGSFTYPRGKKTLDTLKDIIDIVFEEDELKIEKEMTLKGEGVVGTVLLASIHITKNEKTSPIHYFYHHRPFICYKFY